MPGVAKAAAQGEVALTAGAVKGKAPIVAVSLRSLAGNGDFARAVTAGNAYEKTIAKHEVGAGSAVEAPS
ncbi:hypothetical protein [Martelella sp. AMO21009]